MDPAHLRARHPGPRLLLRHAGDGARTSAARSRKTDVGEYGFAELTVLEPACRLLEGVPETSQVWMSHRDSVGTAPAGLRGHRRAPPRPPIAAMEDPARKLYATQFHPEVAHTEFGQQIIRTLPARHRRHPADVDDGQHHRRDGRRACASRSATRPRHLRAVRRRRLQRGGGAAAPRHRRPAHLRLRRPRHAAPRRGRAGRAHASATSSTSTSSTWTPRTATCRCSRA